jgi:hypothetical protein
MVTPEIVGAMTPDQVPAAPGSELTIPNDWQFFGLGMIQGEPMPEDDDYARATETSVPPRYRTYSSSPGQMSLHGPWGPAEPWEIVE